MNALLHGAGLLTVSQVWRCPQTAWADDTRALCARLMRSLQVAADDEAAVCLVGISLRCLTDHPAFDALSHAGHGLTTELYNAGWRGRGDIFVQVAAPTLAARRNLVHIARRGLGPFAYLEAEDVGNRLVAEEGDFPLPFSPMELHEATSIAEGPAAGASWLVYQRWSRDASSQEPAQLAPFDAAPENVLDADASRHPDGSVRHVRRAFSFRGRDDDGVCAITASADAARMAELIAASPREPDDAGGALRLADVGFFVAPPSPQWLHYEGLTPPKSTSMPA